MFYHARKSFYALSTFIIFLIFTSCEGEDPNIDNQPPDDNQPPSNECGLLASNLAFDNNVNIFGLGAIANDVSNVYLYTYSSSTGGTIQAISKSNNQLQVLAGSLGGVNNIAIDESYIYWLEYDIGGGNGKVRRVLKDGSGAIETLAEGNPQNPDGTQSAYNVFFPNGLILDDNFLYWGEEVGGAAIRKISKSGGAVEDIDRGGGFKVMALTSDNDHIYAIDANNNGQILKFDKATGTRTVLTSGIASSQAFSNLAIDNGKLYWTEITNNGSAYSFDLNTSNMSTIKSSLTNPRSIFMNATDIFLAAGNGIFQINRATGVETNLSCSNLTVPFTISIDNNFVYIVDNPISANGQLLKYDF